jgi:hypothetical protein
MSRFGLHRVVLISVAVLALTAATYSFVRSVWQLSSSSVSA